MFYGTLVAAFTPQVSNYIILSLFGIFPWVIITNYYNCNDASDPLEIYIRKDGGYSVAMYAIVSVFVFFISDQRNRALNGLKQAVVELEQKNTKINEMNIQLKQSLEDKDSFILLLSHETRNPLNILMGNLSLLIQESKDAFPQFLDKLNKCKFCSELLLQYINNILDCGKLNNQGKLDITNSPTNLKEFLLKTWRLMEALITKKGLQACFTIVSQLPEYVKIDSQRVTQILLNIIGNASKFTDKGSVTLNVTYLPKVNIQENVDFLPESLQIMTLLDEQETNVEGDSYLASLSSSEDSFEESIHPYQQVFEKELSRGIHRKDGFADSASSTFQEKQGFLKFEVIDTGCGIDKENLNKLFRKFSQVGNDTQKRAIGTGLGLWISRSLCIAMGGDIKVYSKPGKGTCFSIILEAPAANPKKEGLSVTCLRSSQNHLQTLPSFTTLPNISRSEANEVRQILRKRKTTPQSAIRILLADDEPDNLDLHKKILKQLGYDQIETAMNGIELVDTYISKPSNYYSCIITEISMPLMNGVKAIKKIREFERTNKRSFVPVGFITGHTNTSNMEECTSESIQAQFFHSKPINLELLQNLLNGIGVNANRQQHKPNTTNVVLKQARNLVLCVDDDLYNLQVLKGMLEKHNLTPILCNRGTEAIQTFQESCSQIKCVILDCNMPGKDGWETSSEMENYLSQNDLEDVPLYGLTGDDLTRVKDKFFRSGMTALLMKPIDFQTISHLVNGLL